MATTRHMIRKLEQAGFEVTVTEGRISADGIRMHDQIDALLDGYRIDFYGYADGTGSSPHVVRDGLHADSQSDYFPGSFADNITQAIARAAMLRESRVSA